MTEPKCYPIFILFLVISACTTTHTVKPEETLILDKSAIIVTVDQPPVEFNVHNVFAGRDSLVAPDMFIQRVHKFHLSEIDRVVVKNRYKGACLGFLTGGLGASTAAAITFGTDGMASVAVGFLGVAGALLGTIPGSIVGTKTHYVFEKTSYNINPIDSSSQTRDDYTLTRKDPIITAAKTVEHPDSDSLAVALQNPTEKLSRVPGTIRSVKENSTAKPRQLSLEEIAKTQLPDIRPKYQNQVGGMFYTRSKNRPVNWVAGYAFRRYFQMELVLPPRFEQGGKYYLNLSYKYITGHVEEPTDYYLTSKMYSGLLGLEAFSRGNFLSGSAGFVELGFTAGSLGREYARHDDNSLGGVGITGVLGYRAWSNILFAEGRINYTTWFGHVTPAIVVGYRF